MKKINNDFDKIDRDILDYLKKNPREALKLGVRGVANKFNTIPSRIVRLAKKLNYSGFLEMIYSFKYNDINEYDNLTIEIRKKFFLELEIKKK